MLLPADAAVVSRDPKLAGLATILDADALVRALRNTGKSIERAELTYLRYKPSTNCVGAYRVLAGHEWTSMYAKAHGADASVKLAKGCDRQSPDGSRVALDREGILVCTFPDDVKLPVLGRLAEPRARRDLMDRIFDGRQGMDTGTFETLTYKPERRCVGHWKSEAGSAVIKFYVGPARTVARAGWGAFSSREVLQIARKSGGSKRHGVLAFEWLEGEGLREVLAESDAIPVVRLVARALAELHGQSSDRVGARGLGDRVRELREKAEALVVLCPSASGRAIDLAERLANRLSEEPEPRTCIHGDLYDKQILVRADRIGVIDLDRAALGDPRIDLGLFLAHLDRDVLLGRLSATRVAAIEGALLDAYQDARGQKLGPVAPYIAEALLQLAHHPFRAHLPGWPERTAEIVDRAEHRLAERS